MHSTRWYRALRDRLRRSPRPRLDGSMEPNETAPRVLFGRQNGTIVQLPRLPSSVRRRASFRRRTNVRAVCFDRHGTRKDGPGSGLVSVWEHTRDGFVRFERWDLAASRGRRRRRSMGVRQFFGRSRDRVQRGRVLCIRDSFSELQQRQIGLGVGRFVMRAAANPPYGLLTSWSQCYRTLTLSVWVC